MIDIKFSEDELQRYKVDMQNILQSQIGVLSNIERDILAYEDEHDEENRILTSKKSKKFREILNGEVLKVKNFDVVLAVVGTMKAGKSTTINAIVGREILPNRNRPMTALPTLICHNPQQYQPKLTFQNTMINEFLSKVHKYLTTYQHFSSDILEIQKLIDLVRQKHSFDNEYQGADNIFNFLQQLNDLVRLNTEINDELEADELEPLHFPYESYRNINSLPMIEIAFTSLNDVAFNTQGRFMLLDTPGPNEAGQEELRPMLAEQLERSSAVMMVLDYTQLNSEAEEGVKQQINSIPTIQKSRLFAVVNKFDQKNANADDKQTTINHVYNNLLKGMIDKNNIYPISAQDAYLASRMKSHLIIHEKKPNFLSDSWIEDFANTAFGSRAERKYNKADIEDIQEETTILLEDSMIEKPLTNIVGNMHKNAPIITIQSALIGSSEVFNNLHNFLSIRSIFTEKEKLTEVELERLENSIAELKTQVQELDNLKESAMNSIEFQITQYNDSLEEQLNTLEHEVEQDIAHLFEDKTQHQDTYIDEVGRIISGNHKSKRDEEDKLTENIHAYIESFSNGEQIVFSSPVLANKFKQDIKEKTKALKTNVIHEFTSKQTEMKKGILQKLNQISDDSQTILNKVDNEFKKNNVHLILQDASVLNFDSINNTAVNLSFESKQKEEKMTIPSTYLMSGIIRGVGSFFRKKTWGYTEIEEETFIIEKTKVIKDVTRFMETQVFSPLRRELDEEKDYISELTNDNVTKVTDLVKDITGEITLAIRQEKMPEVESLKRYKERIILSNKTYNDTQENWRNIAEKFHVTAIENNK